MVKACRLITLLAAFSLLIGGCNTKTNNSNNSHNITTDGPSFSKWDTSIETERELWNSDDKYQDVYICAIFDNPNQNEIISLTINDNVYPSSLFIRDYEGGLYSSIDRITVKATVPNKVGTYSFEVKSLKFLDGTTIKEKLFSDTKPLSIKVTDPKAKQINKLVIMHSLGSDSSTALQAKVAEYLNTHPTNVDVEVRYEGSNDDLKIKIINQSSIYRQKVIVIGSLDENDYKDVETVTFNSLDNLLTQSTIQSINTNLINRSKDSNGHIKKLPVYWYPYLSVVNKTALSGYYGANYQSKLNSFSSFQSMFSEINNTLYPHFSKTIYANNSDGLIIDFLNNNNYVLPTVNNSENLAFMTTIFQQLYTALNGGDGVNTNYYDYPTNPFGQQNSLITTIYPAYYDIVENYSFDVDYIDSSFGDTLYGTIYGAYYLDFGDISEDVSIDVNNVASDILNSVLGDATIQQDIAYRTVVPANTVAANARASSSETFKGVKYCVNNNLASKVQPSINSYDLLSILYNAYHQYNYDSAAQAATKYLTTVDFN